MGGGAIKKNGVSICSRLPKAAYLSVKAHVLATLAPHVLACEGVLELPGKMDFGDLDILYCEVEGTGRRRGSSSPPLRSAAAAGGGGDYSHLQLVKGKLQPHVPLTLPEIIKGQFGVVDPTHTVRHGPVTSFAFDIKSFFAETKKRRLAPPLGEDDSDSSLFAAAAAAATVEVEALPTDYFQIDLIRAPSPEQLAMCRFYFGYGDVGGILGRIFNYYGMKLGEAGLWCELFSHTVAELHRETSVGGTGGGASGTDEEVGMKLLYGHVPVQKKVEAVVASRHCTSQNSQSSGRGAPGEQVMAELLAKAVQAGSSKDSNCVSERKDGVVDPTATLGRVPLTSDPAAICLYAGLDYPLWCKGFNTVDEVVAWLVDCHLFLPSIFDRLNYEHMQRAVKRPFYQKFLDHINMTPGKAGATQVRSNRQLQAIRHFKQEGRLHAILRGIEVAKERREKFNGKLLADVILAATTPVVVTAPVAAPLSQSNVAATSVLEGKALGQAITDFKADFITSGTTTLFHPSEKNRKTVDSEALLQAAALTSSTTEKQHAETLFNALLDEMSVAAVHAAMARFAATYIPPAPVVAAGAGKKKK